MESCIFCKIIKGEIPSQKIAENEAVIVFLSLQNHPLVVPKKHAETIYELDEQTTTEVMKMALKVSKAIKKGLNPDGLNLIQNNGEAAGQEVFHFHLHLRPRWKKDAVQLHLPTEPVAEEEKKSTLEKIKSNLD